MAKKALLLAALAFIVLLAVPVAGAVTKKWYWSEEKAEGLAAAKVRINFCLVFDPSNASPKCANPETRKHQGFYGLNEVACTGADERGETFTFARFKCRFVAGVRLYDYAVGRLTLHPVGRTQMRWKLVSLARL